MHITSIYIKNFKSYLDFRLNDLNPCLNVVIGKNGHGKSNFFQGYNLISYPPSPSLIPFLFLLFTPLTLLLIFLLLLFTQLTSIPPLPPSSLTHINL